MHYGIDIAGRVHEFGTRAERDAWVEDDEATRPFRSEDMRGPLDERDARFLAARGCPVMRHTA